MVYDFEQNLADMIFEEILMLRDMAEQTGVQFKERVAKENKSEVSAESVAMSNTRGGKIVIGIDDGDQAQDPSGRESRSHEEIQSMTSDWQTSLQYWQ